MAAKSSPKRLFQGLAAVRRRLAAGARDERGAAAVYFAVAVVLLAPLALGVVDVYIASRQRAQLQDALDAAALFAARSTATTSDAVDAIGDRALLANLRLPSDATLVSSTFALNGDTVTASAELKPTAIAPGFFMHSNVLVNATVVRSLDKIELALVLDNTGSMAGTKLSTLKSSANSLIDKLVAAAARSTDPTPLKVALVPFSMTVRVQGSTPTSSYDTTTHSGAGFPTWLDPQGKAHVALGSQYDTFSAQTDRFAILKQMKNTPWEGCVESRRQPYDIQDTAPTPVTPATMFTPYFWPDELDTSSSAYPNNYQTDPTSGTWLSKQQNVAKYTKAPKSGTFATGYIYGPNSGCGMQPIIPLTTNTASIKTAVNAMVAVGDTNIPMGLVWGWHALSPNPPLANGAAYGTDHLRKIVILMTDGDNTMFDPGNGSQNQSYYSGLGYIWQGILGITSGTTAQRTTAMDNRLSALCTNMKAKDIVIYTVRVEVKSGTSTVLKNCASSADKFYDVQDVSQLGAAFDSIAGSIDNLRLSK